MREEIHCDKYGRLKVQFFPLGIAKARATIQTSCWLSSLPPVWAGNQYAAAKYAIPQNRQWKVPDSLSLEGDPDQPALVTGCL